MGYIRGTQPAALDRAAVTAIVRDFIGEQEIAAIIAVQDPFLVAHDCVNPAGHQIIPSCGEIVCAHCAAIFWR